VFLRIVGKLVLDSRASIPQQNALRVSFSISLRKTDSRFASLVSVSEREEGVIIYGRVGTSPYEPVLVLS
jgi:hypothetical protein